MPRPVATSPQMVMRPVQALAAVPSAPRLVGPQALEPVASASKLTASPTPPRRRATTPPRTPPPPAGRTASTPLLASRSMGSATTPAAPSSPPVAGRRPPATPLPGAAAAGKAAAAAAAKQYAAIATTASALDAAVEEQAAGSCGGSSATAATGLLEYSKELGQKVSSLQAEVVRLREERDNLEAENAVIGEYIMGLQKENGKLQDKDRTAQQDRALLTKQAEGHGVEAKHMRQTMEEQARRIQSLTAENSKLRQQVEGITNDRMQLNQKVRTLEVSLESLQGDLVQRLGREAAVEQHAATLGRELEETRAQKGHADITINALHLDVARLRQLAQELEMEKAQNHELKLKLETADREISRCYQEKAEMDQVITTLHVETAQSKTKLESALCEVPQLHGSLQQQSALVTDLQAQVVHLKRSLHESQGVVANLERDAKSTRLELDTCRRERTQYEQALAVVQSERGQLKSALDSLTAGKAEADRLLSSTLGEKGMIHSHFEEVNAQREQLQAQIHQAAAENAALRGRLAGVEKVVRGCQDETWRKWGSARSRPRACRIISASSSTKRSNWRSA